jgi:hypothetical protein
MAHGRRHLHPARLRQVEDVSCYYQRSSDWELQGATSGNVYGEALAKEGFVVIAFDASFQGAGGGIGFCACQGLRRRGRPVSRDIDTGRIAFCGTENISTPNLSYAAQYLACAFPCERFTSALADNPRITRGRYGSLLLCPPCPGALSASTRMTMIVALARKLLIALWRLVTRCELPRPSAVRAANHWARALFLLEPDKTPSQLDHAAADADIAGARKTPFASTAAALVGRAGQAGVAGDGPAIAPVAREDLVDQHVRRFDTNAKDTAIRRTIVCGPAAAATASLRRRSCSTTRIWSRTMRSRARWRRSSASVFCGNGVPSAVRRSSSLSATLRMVGRKVRRPKRVNIAFIWLIIRICSVTRFRRSRFGRLASSSSIVGIAHHAAMARLAAQPAEKNAHQKLRIETIGLRAPVFARHRDAGRMDDVNLDIARPQPARQPEPVAARLIGDDDTLDVAPSLAGFAAPRASAVSSWASNFLRGWRSTPGMSAATASSFGSSRSRR